MSSPIRAGDHGEDRVKQHGRQIEPPAASQFGELNSPAFADRGAPSWSCQARLPFLGTT